MAPHRPGPGDGTLVVKIGGRAQQAPGLAAALADRWTRAPGRLVVVHGGGDEATALLRLMGHEPRFEGGRRVTGRESLDALRMALSGAANKRLVAALVTAGVPAVGISGEDAWLLVAWRGDGALGEVGVAPVADARVLHALLAARFMPVVSPLARHARAGIEGEPDLLNVNGDDAAAAIAGALGAELLLVSDVPAVLDGGAPVAALDPDGARAMIARGAAAGGMAAKLEAAVAALRQGATRVRVGDAAALSDASLGTVISPTAPGLVRAGAA